LEEWRGLLEKLPAEQVIEIANNPESPQTMKWRSAAEELTRSRLMVGALDPLFDLIPAKP
jgi:uncharacterized NAD-dependent epimerase/dehydratase family protein